MKNFNIEASIITSVSETPLKLNFFYKKTLCHEHWLMPWETGFSKNLSFSIYILDNDFALQNLEVNGSNNHSVIFETIKVNDNIQKLSSLIVQNETVFNLNQCLNIQENDFSVVKLSDLPQDISVSYAYNCNNSVYVPGCDTNRSIVTISTSQAFSFSVELFKANIVEAAKHLLCTFDGRNIHIEEKINITRNTEHGHMDARILRSSLEEHFEVREDEIQNDTSDYSAPIIYIQNALKDDIMHMTNAIKNEVKDRFYSVIKLSGLSKNMIGNNVFYNDGSYFLTKDAVDKIELKNFNKIKDDKKVIVNFFGENTGKPLKTMIFHIKTNEKIETKTNINNKNSYKQRKKSA